MKKKRQEQHLDLATLELAAKIYKRLKTTNKPLAKFTPNELRVWMEFTI